MPLTKRDLYFWNDGELATWKEDEDAIGSSVVPEGELTIDEVKSEYGNFYNKLKSEVPNISDSQIRKIINVTLSMCSSCHNEDSEKCHCWKY
jgi:hypothetical protein